MTGALPCNWNNPLSALHISSGAFPPWMKNPVSPLRLISEAREWGEALTLADLGRRLSRPKKVGSGSCFRGTKPYGGPRVTSTALGLSVLTPELLLPLHLRHSSGISGFRSNRAWGPGSAVLWSSKNWGCEELTRVATQKDPPPPPGRLERLCIPAPPGAFAVTWEWGRDQSRSQPIGCAVRGRDSQ